MANTDFNKPLQFPKVESPRPVLRTARGRNPGDDPIGIKDPNGEDTSLIADDDGVTKVAGLQTDLDSHEVAVAPDDEQDEKEVDEDEEDDENESDDDDDDFDDDDEEEEDEEDADGDAAKPDEEAR